MAALPRSSRLREFLKTSLDLCGERLLPALAERLLAGFRFIPRVILHESSLAFSATSYCILSRSFLRVIRAKARRGALSEEGCLPVLRAVEVTLLTSFELDSRLVKKIAR